MADSVSQFNLFDYALLAILIISTLLSLLRGFFREAMSLGAWVVAIWVAWTFGAELAELLEAWIAPSAVRIWAARALLVIGVLIAGGLLAGLLGFLLQSTGLSGTDRAIGMVFGFARGVVLAGLLLTVLQAADFDETEWWPESVLIPYFEPVTDMIRHAAEDGMEFLEEFEDSSS